MADPVNNTPTPTPVPAAQTNEQGFKTNPTPDASAAPDVQAPAAAAPAMPVSPAAPAAPTPDPKHSMIGQIFQDIAGGQKTVYDQTAQGPVPRKVDLKPGEIARTILASAFSLMAAGAAGAQGKRIDPSITIGGMREDRDAQAQEQAQQQFKNKQSADAEQRQADELTLQKSRDAREQQDDILKARLMGLNIQREAFGLSHDNLQYSEDIAKHLNDQAIKMETDRTLGVQRAKIGTVDTPTFTGPDAQAKMQDYITKNVAALTAKGFVLTPRWGIGEDGQLSGYLAEEPRPQGPIAVGFKMDKNGQPALDANGQRIPDGSIKGPDGKPTGFMAPDFTSAETIINEQKKSKLLDVQIADVRAQINERNAAHAKDEVYQTALKDYTKHNGDISSMDPGNRMALLQKTTTDWLDAGKTFSALQTSGAPDDVLEDARREFQQLSRMRLELATNTNIGVLNAKKMREAGVPDNTILQTIGQQKGLTKADIAQAREFVIGDVTVDDMPSLFTQDKTAAADKLKKLATLGLPKATAVITNSTLDPVQQQGLLKEVQKLLGTAPAAVAPPDTRPPDQRNREAVSGIVNSILSTAPQQMP